MNNVWKETGDLIALVITNKKSSPDHMEKRFQQVPVMEQHVGVGHVVNTYEMLHPEDHEFQQGHPSTGVYNRSMVLRGERSRAVYRKGEIGQNQSY